MMPANLFKLAILFLGFIGYFTGTEQYSREVQSIAHNHRDRRNIYLNAKAPILIAAFITIPISVALPALRGRSARSQTESNVTEVPYSYDDPLYAAQLRKIDMYMDYMEIRDDMCRQRFICEVASAPDTYSPLYGIFKKQLTTDLEVKKSYFSRFFRYYNALIEGKKSAVQHPADPSAICRQFFGECANDIQETVNMDVLHIMQFLTEKFRIEFADTTA